MKADRRVLVGGKGVLVSLCHTAPDTSCMYRQKDQTVELRFRTDLLVLIRAVPVQMWQSALLGPKFPILRVNRRIGILLATNERQDCMPVR
jgi:hypothetical protein